MSKKNKETFERELNYQRFNDIFEDECRSFKKVTFASELQFVTLPLPMYIGNLTTRHFNERYTLDYTTQFTLEPGKKFCYQDNLIKGADDLLFSLKKENSVVIVIYVRPKDGDELFHTNLAAAEAEYLTIDIDQLSEKIIEETLELRFTDTRALSDPLFEVRDQFSNSLDSSNEES